MAVVPVGNVLKFDNDGDTQAGVVWAKGILFTNLAGSAQTFVIKDGDGTVIFQTKIRTTDSKYISYGDAGFRFENSVEFDAPSSNGLMYIFKV